MSVQSQTRGRTVCVSSIIPAQLENELRNTCAIMRHDAGLDYGETFAEALRLGLHTLQAKRSAARAEGVEVLRRAAR
jgi:hypothetical protein